MQVRDTLRLFLIAVVLAGIPAAPSEAEIIGLSEHEIDLTKPKASIEKVWWDNGQLFGLSEKGLGRTSSPAGTREVTLRTTQPIALGTWWRPTDNASIQATITWAGEHAGAMRGDLYVSYSCGAASWSDWQLVPQTRASTTKTTRVHNTVLQIPRDVRKAYWRELREYGKQDDIAWDSDEEAFTTWKRRRDASPFSRTRPFIGYLRFKYETEVPHGTYLTGMSFDTTWVVSGISSVPSKAVEVIQEKRQGEAWSWRADDRHLDPEGFDRAAATRAVYEALLRDVVAEENERNEKKSDEPPMERILLLADTGRLSAGVARALAEIEGITFKDGPTDKDSSALEVKRKLKPEGVDGDHLDAFLRGRRISGWVPTQLEVGLPITRVRSAWLETFMNDGKPKSWHALAKRFGETRGYTQLSEVVFDAKRTRALVTVGRHVGFLFGAGQTMLLELRDGRWTVISTTIDWIS